MKALAPDCMSQLKTRAQDFLPHSLVPCQMFAESGSGGDQLQKSVCSRQLPVGLASRDLPGYFVKMESAWSRPWQPSGEDQSHDGPAAGCWLERTSPYPCAPVCVPKAWGLPGLAIRGRHRALWEEDLWGGRGGTGPPLEPAVNRAGTGIQLGRRRERQTGVCVEVGVAGGGEAEERKWPLLSHSNSFLFRTSFPVLCSGLSFLLCFLMF